MRLPQVVCCSMPVQWNLSKSGTIGTTNVCRPAVGKWHISSRHGNLYSDYEATEAVSSLVIASFQFSTMPGAYEPPGGELIITASKFIAVFMCLVGMNVQFIKPIFYSTSYMRIILVLQIVHDS